MINDDESDKIIVSAYHYADALQDHIWTYLEFQINHHLVQHLKDNIETFPRIISEFDWNVLIPAKLHAVAQGYGDEEGNSVQSSLW